MNYIYPRKFTKEFLILFREKECLWRKKLPSYKNQKLRQQAYNELLEKLHEIEPTATINDLKIKIEQWRSTYRRQLKLLLQSSRTGYNGPLYVPKLWYFPLLAFINQDEFPNLTALIESLGLPKSDDVETDVNTNKDKEDDLIARLGDEARSGVSSPDLAPAVESNHRKIIRELLEMYRDAPCLWRRDDPHFRNVRVKTVVFMALLKKYHELYPGATLKNLRKRLAYSKMAYRRELKRVIQARMEDKRYRPKIWYFKLLSFLQESEYPQFSNLMCKNEIYSQIEASAVSPDRFEADAQKSERGAYIEEWVVDNNDQHDENASHEAIEGYAPCETSDGDALCETGDGDALCETLEEDALHEASDENAFHAASYHDTLHEASEDDVRDDASDDEDYYPSSEDNTQHAPNKKLARSSFNESQPMPCPVYVKRENKKRKAPPVVKMSRTQEPMGPQAMPQVKKELTLSKAKDRFDVAADNIACKLRELDVQQRIRAEKLISDVLYHAEMKELDSRSIVLISDTKRS